MSIASAGEIFERINQSGCDYFEIESYQSDWLAGRATLCLKCCWCDGTPGNVRFRLRFLDVEYLACSTAFLDSTFHVAAEEDWAHIRTCVNFSELTGESQLYRVETNRADLAPDPIAIKQKFQTDKYFILASSVELETVPPLAAHKE